MTRQEALHYAIFTLQQQPPSKKRNDAVNILLQMAESCKYIKWTKDNVIQALDNWKAEHGRNPSVTDLSEPDMPKGTTIKKLFDMSPSAFMNLYYPRKQNKKPTNKYNLMLPDDYKKIFVKQYQKHSPTSARQYDALRDKGTPSWTTIIFHCGLKTWSELLSFADVEKCSKSIEDIHNRKFTVISHNPSYEKMVKLIEEQKASLAKISKIK